MRLVRSASAVGAPWPRRRSYIETGRTVSDTVSVGVSEFGRDGNTIDTLLRVADERLSGPSTIAAAAWRLDRSV
jgi:hypothetical protein